MRLWWKPEASMQEYEIRILNTVGRTDTVFEGTYISDHSAIRAAQRMSESRPFEVWRGLDCIYGRNKSPASPMDRSSPRPHT
jgi:hypothetical protein